MTHKKRFGKAAFITIFIMIYFISPGLISAQAIFNDVPQKINPKERYLFFLHGQIVEDKGIRPTSEKYGTYEYRKILATFKENGFNVISEARQKNTVALTYAGKVTRQVEQLLAAGVPQGNITVVGASKGGAIAFYVSAAMKQKEINYVIIASCVEKFALGAASRGLYLTGNVLSIYDVKDEFFGSCRSFFDVSRDNGLNRYKEVAVDMGNGHGFHYVPAKEWIDPVIAWARGQQ